MATLSYGDVLIISGLATVGFTLLSFGYSALMARRNWTYQLKAKSRRKRGEDETP